MASSWIRRIAPTARTRSTPYTMMTKPRYLAEISMILAIMIYFQGFGIAFLQSASIDPMPWWIWAHFEHSMYLSANFARSMSWHDGPSSELGFFGSEGAAVATCAADA